MRKKLGLLFVLIFMAIISFNVVAAERTIPVDIFLMIDKSLSMEEPGKFDSLHKWVRDELIGQMLIHGDWITIYQFYERPEHVLTLNVENENSRRRIINTIDAIKPDGHYTDIGYALETIQEALDKRGSNGRYKILLLVTDLEQDAPWTSKYRGKQASFDSPYFAEARIIKRDNWFEITLDMDIQDTVVKRTQSLYSDVIANEGKPRSGDDQSKSLIEGETKVIDKTNKKEGSSNESNESNETDDITQLATSGSTEGFESSTETDIKTDTDDQNSQESGSEKTLAKGSNNEDSEEDFDNDNLENQNTTQVNSEDENAMNDSDNNLVFSDSNEKDSAVNLNSKENKKTKKIDSKGSGIDKSTLFIILIVIAAIVFLILLILLIKYLKDKHDEKEAQKRPKKPLV